MAQVGPSRGGGGSDILTFIKTLESKHSHEMGLWVGGNRRIQRKAYSQQMIVAKSIFGTNYFHRHCLTQC